MKILLSLLLFLLSINAFSQSDAQLLSCVNNIGIGDPRNIGVCKDIKDSFMIELNKVEKGMKIIAAIRIKNKLKNLTTAQRKLLRKNNAEMMNSLTDGSLDVALELANELTPDGSIITQADKDFLIQLLQ